MSEINVVKKSSNEQPARSRASYRDPLFERSLFRANPFTLMRLFTEDMDRLFGAMPKEFVEMADWRPAFDIEQEKGKLLVKADLPGVRREDLKVAVTDGVLTVEGERQHKKEEDREGYFRSERAFGKFCRSIALPEGADATRASAQFANGVLDITVPVAEIERKPQEIPVHDGAKLKSTAA